MNKFDEALSRLPDSTGSWHCPWFRLIEAFCANGAFFGGLAYFTEGEDLGLLAVIVAALVAAFSLGNRSREGTSC